MLLLPDSALDERRRIVAGPLAPLEQSLRADLEPLLARSIELTPYKALLSRAGGRCERDGATLDFDPFSPKAHRCPQCGTVYTGEWHDRYWAYPYHLWLAERAVHGGLLSAISGDQRDLTREILGTYAHGYLTYPNANNVLGPTRLFFSTYLESIWLLQICVATDALRTAGDDRLTQTMIERVIVPSATIIAGYDEGSSNRQVWNNAALMAAALVTGQRASAERIVHAPSGVLTHIANGLLDDGTWYEGENYHFFAHRGLWYCVTMAETAGIELPRELVSRFDEGFAAPFATMLPDMTFPSRKDSQYAVSTRQWRFAEYCELGFARTGDARLAALLARMYADDLPAGDTGRSRSTADVERNGPPTRLTRADLGWRSLLHARAELPKTEARAPRSAHLEGQGVTVFRRDGGEIYVALDWGQSGGGHGHPDRLNLTFAQGATRWLDDMGTGSYVDPSLHWYRSTLAHNAPLVNGESQMRVSGTLVAHDERGGVGWVSARVDGLAPGVSAERAIIVTPDYFVDELRWTAESDVRFELPIHFDGEASGVTFAPRTLDGGTGTEDGFSFVRDAEIATRAAMQPVSLIARKDEREMRAWVCATNASELCRASAPGQPASTARRFYIVRCTGTSGAIRSVWAWSPHVRDARFVDDRVDVKIGDAEHTHRRTPEYWSMEMAVGEAHSGIELFGWRPTPPPAPPARRKSQPAPLALRQGETISWELGESHYRRSEQTWEEAKRPSARVTLEVNSGELDVTVRVAARAPVFVPADAVNIYDNEHPDINGHGVQLYVRTPTDGGGWVIVPEEGKEIARVRRLPDWGELAIASAEWTPTEDGFDVHVRVPLGDVWSPSFPIAFDVIVNETRPERTRRRGQLVLSGARGEFVYLRGDRHDPDRLIPLVIQSQG